MESYEELLKRGTDQFSKIDDILESSFSTGHIKWVAAINAGALLWFFGNIETYSINGKLFCKWWFLIGECLLFISLIVTYRIQVCFNKIKMAFGSLKITLLDQDINNVNNIEKKLKELNSLQNQFPSLKTAIAGEILFLAGITIMSLYVIVFVILKK